MNQNKHTAGEKNELRIRKAYKEYCFIHKYKQKDLPLHRFRELMQQKGIVI